MYLWIKGKSKSTLHIYIYLYCIVGVNQLSDLIFSMFLIATTVIKYTSWSKKYNICLCSGMELSSRRK